MIFGFVTNWRRILGLAALAACLGLPHVWAEPAGATFSADAVKAAYLVNFIRFTEWPSSASGDDTPIVIGVAGNRELEDNLFKITDGKLLQGHKIRVRRLTAPTDATDCQLIYIQPPPRTDTSPFSSQDWLRAVHGSPVLTVSEEEGFLQKGGMINFYADGKNIRFEISPRAAELARLKLSSRLLAIARVVKVALPDPSAP